MFDNQQRYPAAISPQVQWDLHSTERFEIKLGGT
jgi:hypothetical protein